MAINFNSFGLQANTWRHCISQPGPSTFYMQVLGPSSICNKHKLRGTRCNCYQSCFWNLCASKRDLESRCCPTVALGCSSPLASVSYEGCFVVVWQVRRVLIGDCLRPVRCSPRLPLTSGLEVLPQRIHVSTGERQYKLLVFELRGRCPCELTGCCAILLETYSKDLVHCSESNVHQLEDQPQ